MALRRVTKRKIDGKSYDRCGQHKTTKAELPSLKKWAQFQRDVNGNDVRIIEVDGGYEAYMRKGQSGIFPGTKVTVRTVPDKPVFTTRVPTPRKTQIRVPQGDIVHERGRRHLRLY